MEIVTSPVYFVDEYGNRYVYWGWTTSEKPLGVWVYDEPVIDVNDLTPEQFWDIYGPS